MDAVIQMLPPSLRRWSTYIDFPAQHQAERIFQVIIVTFSVIGFFVGYFLQELWITFAILGAGFVLANLVVVPPWPFFRRHPIKWLPEYGDDKYEKKTEEPKEQKKEGKKRQ